MPATTLKTPADLVITPRDRRFGRDTKPQRWWAGGDPIATAFYNSLSITFPRGEAMFVEAVKAHREGVPPKLEAEIKAFVAQEVTHSREHLAFNRQMEEAGYDVTELNAQVEEILAIVKSRPAIVNLCATMALEHFTAILAEQFLTNQSMLTEAECEWSQMWRWHAIEEIEHKGVAYDTWLHTTRHWGRFKRWRVKSMLMLIISVNFWQRRYKGMIELLRQDRITGWHAHRRLLMFLFGSPGVLRKIALPWAAYFLPGFHPWNKDDRHLIGKFVSDYADANLPLARAA